ncbi:MAG: glutamate--cysteine ligase, partial [Actinobacteria bacterium]|nr:glutamate--cysteine ligase [Actinomycetota bacterium]
MGRDVPSITVTHHDRRAYREKVRLCLDVFARMLHEARFDTEPRRVGIEIELNIVDHDGLPAMTNTTVLAAIADPSWASELGRFNLEINVPPRQLAGEALSALEEDVRGRLARAAARAAGTGSRLVTIGILPTLRQADVTAEAMSASPRYR